MIRTAAIYGRRPVHVGTSRLVYSDPGGASEANTCAMHGVRSRCVVCGTYVQARAHPARRWGTWCWRCHSWWPVRPDGSRDDTDLPAARLLVDRSPTTVVMNPEIKEATVVAHSERDDRAPRRCEHRIQPCAGLAPAPPALPLLLRLLPRYGAALSACPVTSRRRSSKPRSATASTTAP